MLRILSNCLDSHDSSLLHELESTYKHVKIRCNLHSKDPLLYFPYIQQATSHSKIDHLFSVLPQLDICEQRQIEVRCRIRQCTEVFDPRSGHMHSDNVSNPPCCDVQQRGHLHRVLQRHERSLLTIKKEWPKR